MEPHSCIYHCQTSTPPCQFCGRLLFILGSCNLWNTIQWNWWPDQVDDVRACRVGQTNRQFVCLLWYPILLCRETACRVWGYAVIKFCDAAIASWPDGYLELIELAYVICLEWDTVVYRSYLMMTLDIALQVTTSQLSVPNTKHQVLMLAESPQEKQRWVGALTELHKILKVSSLPLPLRLSR